MGSGRDNRKKGDSPIIRRPKFIITSVDVNSVNPSVAETVADVCPISFDVRLINSALTKKGVRVHLDIKDNSCVIKIGNTEVGVLNRQRSETITKCKNLGVHYSGEIVLKQDKIYARFERHL
ncbi:hypothetical protein A4H97_32270 [Niastella yeongjuensis]|uniref:Uncharacterized protein n=1 Tax=Niastella yeongjuensis TaxID=354355 RepID=A0A1V9EH87_9BACT|nr:hypothetical protein [Niastella yeongjuensis]OQP45422.1 hypothetical protein A4H97_32270 [Niastella yeongjuensis]SEO75332.1 hypothetical protein SAMN05660816_03422 [Niastella yeongjuensis]